VSAAVFLHVDMDAFFASVEQVDNPDCKGKPVIVGALPGHRGVVSACSYEAREFGIHSAMPISQAFRLCPGGVFLPVRMRRYHEVSSAIMAVLDRYTPFLQQMSVDEAFLDLTGTDRLFGPVIETARKIKEEILNETHLTISVGVAPTKYLAKLASERDKPDGLCVVEPGEESDFVIQLPLKALWGVGKKTLSHLNALGVETVAQLREYTKADLSAHFGVSAANYLYSVCRGKDPGLYGDRSHSHSISGERTFENDVKNPPALERTLLEVAETCMFRLMEERARSRTVTMKLRLADFTTFTQRKTLDHDVSAADELFAVAKELLYRKWDKSTAVRLIGCGLGNIESGSPEAQQDLFDDRNDRQRRAEAAVFNLRQRGLKVGKARLLDKDGPGGSERRD
jgi:DNA polymerase IV